MKYAANCMGLGHYSAGVFIIDSAVNGALDITKACTYSNDDTDPTGVEFLFKCVYVDKNVSYELEEFWASYAIVSGKVHLTRESTTQSSAASNALVVFGATESSLRIFGVAGADALNGAAVVGELVSQGGGSILTNIAVGTLPLEANTTGYHNTATGYAALKVNTTGNFNIANGSYALKANTSGYHNTALGYSALSTNIDGLFNTASGSYALRYNTTGNSNTAVGYTALSENTTASQNSAVGYQALTSNTTGAQNSALGYNTLTSNTTGGANVAIGYVAMTANTTGSHNVAVGFQALTANTAGNYNTSVGRHSLRSNISSHNNVAVGYHALADSTTGGYNTAVGMYAGYSNVTGTYNTCIGYYARPNSTSAVQAVILGYNVTGSGGYTTLGNSTSEIRTAHGSTAWSTVSDERYKKDITDATAGLDFVNALRPITWNYRTLGDLPENFDAYEEGSTEVFKNTQTNHGFIAQEVKAAIEADSSIKDGFRLWDDREDGSQEVAEAALIPVLVKAIQELTARIKTLEEG